jgi:hypothetical protein
VVRGEQSRNAVESETCEGSRRFADAEYHQLFNVCTFGITFVIGQNKREKIHSFWTAKKLNTDIKSFSERSINIY